MNKIPVSKIIKLGKAFFIKHSADILTYMNAAGVVITGIEVYRATKKADEYLRINGYDMANPDTKKVLKWNAAKFYVKPAVIGAATIGSGIGANYINHKKIAGLAAATAVAETALTEYKEQIEGVLGEKEFENLEDDILANKGRKIADIETPVIATGHGDILCIEGLTGQKILSSPEWIRHCQNVYNERVNVDTYCCYAEYLEELYRDCRDVIYIPKWTYDQGYNVHITGVMRFKTPHYEGKENEPAYMVFEPDNQPVTNFMDIF